MTKLISSFVDGICDIVDVSPITRIELAKKVSNDKTDSENIASDWAMVGSDIRSAFGRFANEQEQVPSAKAQ